MGKGGREIFGGGGDRRHVRRRNEDIHIHIHRWERDRQVGYKYKNIERGFFSFCMGIGVFCLFSFLYVAFWFRILFLCGTPDPGRPPRYFYFYFGFGFGFSIFFVFIYMSS